MFDRAKDTASSLAKKKMIGIIIGAITGGGCLLPLIIGVAVLIGILAALGIVKTDSDSVSAGEGSCTYNVNGEEVSDVKVRLLYCDGSGAIPNEELVDFETYITGVVYQETGESSYEALKAQAVVARSFALTRPKQMGNAYNLGLKKENNQWILSLRSCTNDQVFCHPDKGCWSNRKGGQTSDSDKAGWKDCTVYSGDGKGKTWSRGALAADSKIRQAVEGTKGQVLLNSKGEIAVTDFNNTTQEKWKSLASQNKDYFEILTATYGNKHKLSTPNCTSSSSGEVGSVDSADIKKVMSLSDSDAWQQLIGKKTTDRHPSISESAMNKRITTITVPIRVYTGSGNKTKKINKKLQVNKALAGLFTAFFTDIYNDASDFVIDKDSVYCYSYRTATNSSNLSGHAYGVACDINPAVKGNGYGDHVYTEKEWKALPETKAKHQILYKGSKVVQLAHKYTLSWGGEWNSTTDAMHVSFIRDETREQLKKKYLK